jgi:hypothetical protein
MRKLLLIGDNVFSTKKEALSYYKVILNSYHFGESLSDEHYYDVFDLIQYAESFEEECSDFESNLEGDDMGTQNEEECEVEEEDIFIEDIKVSKVQFNTKCFEIFLSNASSYYISYIMIIGRPIFNFDRIFNKACRSAVQNDIRDVKQEYFNKYSVKGHVKCQETEKLSKWEDLAIDHRQPNTFSVIVERFKEVNRIDASAVEYATDERNNIVFKDVSLTENFRAYHRDKSNLRIVRNEVNLSRTGMARITRNSKDLTIK